MREAYRGVVHVDGWLSADVDNVLLTLVTDDLRSRGLRLCAADVQRFVALLLRLVVEARRPVEGADPIIVPFPASAVRTDAFAAGSAWLAVRIGPAEMLLEISGNAVTDIGRALLAACEAAAKRAGGCSVQ